VHVITFVLQFLSAEPTLVEPNASSSSPSRVRRTSLS
jgi:hypothetical protein